MVRRPMAAASCRSPEELNGSTLLPKSVIARYPSRGHQSESGHLPVTMMREPDSIMSVRQTLAIGAVSALIWGGAIVAPAHGAPSKGAPSKTVPANRPRDPAYAFISTRPSEKVVNEVSIMIGYAVKPGSESTLEVGGSTYAMYTQGDGLWIKNAAEEARMVEAMRKSADLVVKATSTKGTETVDTFSTKGLSQALDRVAQDCRR